MISEAKSPFFLYLPLTSPHTPIVPDPEWRGRSAVGDYGDFVMQTDWVLGQIMDALDKAGVSDNTLLVFTSDNGFAPCADILGTTLPDAAGVDSFSILPALLCTADKPVREAIVYHSIHGNFAIQQGRWKLELCPDSGGWSAPRRWTPEGKALPLVQLYDMIVDVGERRNEWQAHPDVASRLKDLLEQYVADGRSTPGPRQENDVKVDIIKAEQLTKTGEE